MLETFYSIAIPTLFALGAVNLFAYSFTRGKNLLVAGLLMFACGIGLLLATLF
jgi:hypothetical protein